VDKDRVRGARMVGGVEHRPFGERSLPADIQFQHQAGIGFDQNTAKGIKKFGQHGAPLSFTSGCFSDVMIVWSAFSCLTGG